MAECIDLADDTGRKVRADKRGAIPTEEPRAAQNLGTPRDHSSLQELGVGYGFWRVVGAADDITAKAAKLKQAFLRDVCFARAFSFL